MEREASEGTGAAEVIKGVTIGEGWLHTFPAHGCFTFGTIHVATAAILVD